MCLFYILSSDFNDYVNYKLYDSVSLVSWLVEILYHAIEFHRGTLSKEDVLPVFVLCGGMAVWQTIAYNDAQPSGDVKKNR